jgi:hypothetical protein
MIYSNDDQDKATRRRDFLLTVYVLPILTLAIICGLVYWASSQNLLTKTDTGYSYFLSLTPAVFVYSFNRRNWLKMPDGTYHNIKGVASTQTLRFNEPSVYEVEYFYSKKEKAATTISGIFCVVLSIWMGFNNSKTVLMPVVTNIAGLFLLYAGLKGWLDKSAKLKIAKNGMWTKKLGFVNWDDINFADVVKEKSGDHPQTYLEVRLKGTVFDEANQPDERLMISDLKDYKTIETEINTSITNYNAQKNGNNAFA